MQEHSRIDVRDYLAVVGRWLWLIVSLAVLAGITVFFVSTRRPHVYEARAGVLVAATRSDISLEPKFQTVEEAARPTETLAALVRSPHIAATVIDELGSILDSTERDNPDALLERVVAETNGQLINVVVSADSPAGAARVANVWARNYVTYVNQLYSEGGLTPSDLDSQLAEARENYAAAEAALTRFQGDNRIDSLQREINIRRATLDDYYATVLRWERVIADAKTLQGQLQVTADSPSAVTAGHLSFLLLQARAALPASSVGSRQLDSATGAVPFQLQLVVGDADNPNDVVGLREEVGNLIANLQQRQLDMESLIADESLERQVLQLQQELEEENARRQELIADRDLAWETYQTVTRKVAELQVASDVGESVVRFAVPATEPVRPVSPRPKLYSALAAVLAGMLALGGAFLVDYLEDRIRTTADIERNLGIAPLAAVAVIDTYGGSEPVTSGRPRSLAAESLRVLRTRLWLTVDRRLNSVLLVGAQSRAGATTVASNLAVVMAQAGRSVILVDADLRHPTIHEVFNLRNERGLSTILTRGDGVSAVDLQPTAIDNLRVLTSGPLPVSPADLLESSHFGEVISKLEHEADLVVLDGPAISTVTDGVVLAQHVERVLLVVGAGSTSTEAARAALVALEPVGVETAVVLNRFRPGLGSNYYHADDRGQTVAQMPSGRWTSVPMLGHLIRLVRG